MSTDVENATDYIRDFLSDDETLLRWISSSVANVFEALCVIYVAECYEKMGYQVNPEGISDDYFKFKCSTRGDPAHFSYFNLAKGEDNFELRHNLWVSGARDSHVLYVIDIGITRCNSIKDRSRVRSGRRYRIHYCQNSDLITFAECKHLVAYSMLIAQFLGVVFELKPRHLRGKERENLLSEYRDHIFPTLLISGTTHIGAESVIKSLDRRKYSVIVAAELFKSPEQLFTKVSLQHTEQQSLPLAPKVK